MFGKLRAARDTLRRSFAAQFDVYQGQIVYRNLMKGPPIAVSDAERDGFVADFEQFIPRYMWGQIAVILPLLCVLIIVDESGLLPMPDWVPLVAVLAMFPLAFIVYRRAMTVPGRTLASRPPMGGERSRTELAEAHLRAMAWPMLIPSFVLGGAMIALVGFAAINNPAIFREAPLWMVGLSLFGGWLFFAASMTARRKWRLEH